ncbi:MAG: hypothetical protein IKL68_03515 [Clostridia bacterium]|nr:hypothetical protein [Clostridia bacterium]
MKKFNFKRLCTLLLGLCSLILFISFTATVDGPGVDYTKEFGMYLDIKEMTSLEEVETYLDNLNVSYDINESKLTLPDYGNIEYVINTDNSSGYLLHSTLMHNLNRLDERDLDIVTVKKETIDNEIIELIYLEDNGLTYTKIANKYYIEPTIIYLILIPISFFSFIILLTTSITEYIGVFFDWLKKKRDEKKNNTAKDAETKTENETTEA